MSDKVRELAEKLRDICDDGQNAVCPSLDSVERILRAELEPLLNAAEALAHYDGSRSCDNCLLGTELEGWRKP